MNKRWLWILIGLLAFSIVLFSGAVAGAGITYFALQASPVRAARAAILEVADQSDDDYEAGILVQHVELDSPADEAGIKRGDIILAVNDKEVNTMAELMAELEDKSSGDEVTLTVQHCETTKDTTIQLEERNGNVYLGLQFSRSRFFDFQPFDQGTGRLALETPAFIITSVVPDSPADEAGLEPGEMILAVDDEKFEAQDELSDIIQAFKPGDQITFELFQTGADETRQETITLGENPDQEDQAYLGIAYTRLPGFGAMAPGRGGRGPFFHFDIPGSKGENTPLPELPKDLMPFLPDIPALKEGIEQAVVIKSLSAKGPAEQAGLEAGDVVTAVDGEEIEGPDSFVEKVHSYKPGDEITLTVYREGEDEAVEINVTLGENPDEEGQAYLGVEIGGLMQFNNDGEGENPFHFKFNFPWKGDDLPEKINPPAGDEA